MNSFTKAPWDMYDVWNDARIKSAYTRRRAIVLKTRALIEMDRTRDGRGGLVQ